MGRDVSDEGTLREEIERLRAALQEAEREAMVDAMTGCLNRRGWTRSLEHEERRCRRHELDALVVVDDLDGLKAINDTHGHSAGDEAIRLTAQALRDVARESDVVARIGGDEFLVVGRAPVGVGDVQALIDRLQRAVTRCGFVTRSGPVTLGCSIGSSLSEGDDDVDSLVAKADAALYRAKQRGRALTP